MRFLLCFLFVSALGATPVTITSGNITLQNTSASSGWGTFSFAGDGFSATGIFGSGAINNCTPCRQGQESNMFIGMSGSSISGSVTVGDTYYPTLGHWTGPRFLNVTVTPILLTGPGVFTSTFSFAGMLCGRFGDPRDLTPCGVMLDPMAGAGLYSLTLASIQSPDEIPRLAITAASYAFSAPAPDAQVHTPEPGTWLAGAAALVILIRRINR